MASSPCSVEKTRSELSDAVSTPTMASSQQLETNVNPIVFPETSALNGTVCGAGAGMGGSVFRIIGDSVFSSVDCDRVLLCSTLRMQSTYIVEERPDIYLNSSLQLFSFFGRGDKNIIEECIIIEYSVIEKKQ